MAEVKVPLITGINGITGQDGSCLAELLLDKRYSVVASESHSDRKLLELAFHHVVLNWKEYAVHDDRYKRPHDVAHVLGDSSKHRRELGWRPQRSFHDLVTDMVDADLGTLQSACARTLH